MPLLTSVPTTIPGDEVANHPYLRRCNDRDRVPHSLILSWKTRCKPFVVPFGQSFSRVGAYFASPISFDWIVVRLS
jgi:hypothetical protein